MLSYVRSDSVVSRIIAGETLIVPVRKGVGDLASIYRLNAVGSAIWQAIAQPRCAAEIIQAVEQEFDGERGQIAGDVESFLAEMTSVGLVHATGAGA